MADARPTAVQMRGLAVAGGRCERWRCCVRGRLGRVGCLGWPEQQSRADGSSAGSGALAATCVFQSQPVPATLAALGTTG